MTNKKLLEVRVEIDENSARKIYLDELEKHIKKMNAQLTFWDIKELRKQTCMSINTIQKEFFYDPRFPKRKVGGKWYFPAEKTREFLLMWLDEQVY